ncbi:unnamed protein product [Victoria cruziana]
MDAACLFLFPNEQSYRLAETGTFSLFWLFTVVSASREKRRTKINSRNCLGNMLSGPASQLSGKHAMRQRRSGSLQQFAFVALCGIGSSEASLLVGPAKLSGLVHFYFSLVPRFMRWWSVLRKKVTDLPFLVRELHIGEGTCGSCLIFPEITNLNLAPSTVRSRTKRFSLSLYVIISFRLLVLVLDHPEDCDSEQASYCGKERTCCWVEVHST